MRAVFSRTFDKQFKKLPLKTKTKVTDTIVAYLLEGPSPNHRIHGLKGEWRGHYSMSAGGDLRVHFRIIDKQEIMFVAAGSHSQLYK